MQDEGPRKLSQLRDALLLNAALWGLIICGYLQFMR